MLTRDSLPKLTGRERPVPSPEHIRGYFNAGSDSRAAVSKRLGAWAMRGLAYGLHISVTAAINSVRAVLRPVARERKLTPIFAH